MLTIMAKCVQFVIVVDDENGDDVEGNLIMAASLTSAQDVAFMVKHGSGIVSVGMKEEDLQRLKLPLMSPETEYEDSSAPTFTITVVSFPLFHNSEDFDFQNLHTKLKFLLNLFTNSPVSLTKRL